MGIIKDTLSKIFPKKKTSKQTLAQNIQTDEPSLDTTEKPVVEAITKADIEATAAEMKDNLPQQTAPLSIAEKTAQQAQSLGLNVRVMTPDEAKEKSQAAKDAHIKQQNAHYGTDEAFIRPSIDDLYLIRATDIFPEDSTMTPVSNSLRMASFTNNYFINRVIRHEAAKLGIKQKDGQPVTCKEDLSNVELSPEIAKHLDAIDLGPEFKKDEPPIKKFLISSKHKAEKIFNLPLKSTRETIHFTMNSRVSSHSGGSWENLPFVFIEPYKPHHGTFKSIGGFDSWTKGDMHLESPTLLTRPETLEQLIKLSKTNPAVKSTLKKCNIVLMDTRKTHDSNYVSAILHEQGAPAYACKDTYVLAVDDEKNPHNQIRAQGLENSLKELSQELEEKGIQTSCNALHANTPEANEEKKAATCQGYDSTIKFARFLADKINHRGLSDKIKEFEALDTPEKMEAFYRTEVIAKVEKQCTEASRTNHPNVRAYFDKYSAVTDVLKGSSDKLSREAGMKEFLMESIMEHCAPILDQMSDDKVARLCSDFQAAYTAELEKIFHKPIKFDSTKQTTTPQLGES